MSPPPTHQRAFRWRSARRAAKAGLAAMTLLEMTVVILVVLVLISVMFIGARAWKRGADRALCIMNLQRVQKGLRSYSNLYGLAPGATVPDLRSQIIGLGRFVEATPDCPTGGTYTYGASYGVNTIPPIGTLYMDCSLASSAQHAPSAPAEW